MTWNAAGDELVNVRSSEQMVTDMTAAGIRFVHWLFPTSDHLTLATNDEFGPAAEFLGEHRVDRDPPHVSYVVDVGEDSADANATGDHAYWVSGLRLADSQNQRRGLFDVRSAGFGVGDPEVLPVKTSQGTLQGGSHGPMPYEERRRDWGDTPVAARTSKLFVRATNIAAATIDATRARVGCAPKLYLAVDAPLDLAVDCAQKPKRARRCARSVTATLPRVAARPNVEVTARRRGKVLRRVEAGRILRMTIRRPTRKAFALDFVARSGGDGPATTLSFTRRFGACGR
jgi:hypothetical protein